MNKCVFLRVLKVFLLIDWRTVLQKVLRDCQDLSQAKSEATPPDGLLSVSLLKHQVHYSFFEKHTFVIVITYFPDSLVFWCFLMAV